MKILFLDDMPARHRVASQWFPAGADIVRAHDAYECLGLYIFGQSSLIPFDLVSLDHDLGSFRTGLDVVNQIVRLHAVEPCLARPRFTIHSWNPDGARKMHEKLALAGFSVTREPFSPPAYKRALSAPKGAA